jgi:hypothetical protein
LPDEARLSPERAGLMSFPDTVRQFSLPLIEAAHQSYRHKPRNDQHGKHECGRGD